VAIQIYKAITDQNSVTYRRLFLPVIGTLIYLRYIFMTKEIQKKMWKLK